MIANLQTWLSANPVGPTPMGEMPLTTLERAFAWLSPDQGTTTIPDPQRDLMRRLIPAVSGLAMSWMNRDTLARTLHVDTYQGSRTGIIVLRQWPVLLASSVTASPASAPMAQSLWRLEAPTGAAQRIVAVRSAGGSLVSGPDGVTVAYEAGFVRTEEIVVPADSPYTVETASMLLRSEGVVDASGVNVDPSLYTVSGTTYTFNPTLAGASLTLVYSYVPESIEQAVIEEIGLAWRSRQRIGEASKALPNGGGTSSYMPRRLSDIAREAMNNYRRVVPS